MCLWEREFVHSGFFRLTGWVGFGEDCGLVGRLFLP